MKTHGLVRRALVGLGCLLAPLIAGANAVLEWNELAINSTIAAKQGPTINTRTMAMVHAAVFDAVNAVQPRYRPYKFTGTAPPGASADAAAAAAAHTVLVKVFPEDRARFDAALTAALGKVPEETARKNGAAVGTAAGQAILAWCAEDRVGAPTEYRPVTKPGAYVSTVLPVGLDMALSRPWLLPKADQFRPPPPPALSSETWATSFNETVKFGARTGSARNDEQTQVAQFWVVTGAPAFNQMIRQAVSNRNLGLAESARLTALVYMAFTDALVAVFDAKYAYQFWRPITAVRNGDQHDNPQVKRVAGWMPLVEAPLHPEYPCAHCISAATVGQVLQSELGDDVGPLSMTSPTLPGVTRKWNKVSEFVQEVSDARVWSGVHYRFSAQVGQEMGRKVATYAVKEYLQPR